MGIGQLVIDNPEAQISFKLSGFKRYNTAHQNNNLNQDSASRKTMEDKSIIVGMHTQR